MTVQTTILDVPQKPSKMLSAGLWVAQFTLAAMYGMAGYMKALLPLETLVQMGIAWAADAPVWLIRFIGTAELAGATGLILPALTRILPGLTLAAAVGLVAIQALAIPFHILRGEFAPLPFNVLLLVLAVFVVWGRAKKAPIAARG